MFPDSASPVRGIAAAFILVAFLSWLALRPAQATAPATDFSAARAGADLALLAKTPRPIASSANHQARAWLVERLRAIGLDPQVQRALVQKNYVDYNANYEATMGVVHNVLVRLPGTAPDRFRDYSAAACCWSRISTATTPAWAPARRRRWRP